MTCLLWTINSWQAVNSIGCLLMLKSKVQMCTVIHHQCRRRQMCGKSSHIHIHYTHFRLLQKMTSLHCTIHSWLGFNSLGSPLMLRTNYICVRSHNIRVDVAKCMEQIHKFTQYTHFLFTENIACVDWTFSTHLATSIRWCWVTQNICSLFLA